MNICIIGAGAWGTAMAVHLGRCVQHTVTLVARRHDHALALATSRENAEYLPGVELPADLQLGCELKPVLMEAEVLLLAVPSRHLRAVCRQVAAHRGSSPALRLVLTLCKGLEEETNLRPCEVVAQELEGYTVGALSGPTFAGEVAAGQPAAIVLGFRGDAGLASGFQHAISDAALRVYTSADLDGVELGGCLKNVYAIAAGICDGLRLGDNAKAALLTRSLAEMVRLGTRLGGQPATFYGLSGFGDLIATCNGAWSRNRTFGQRIAEGGRAEELAAEMTVEGYRTTFCFHRLCRDAGIEAPILEQIHAVLSAGKQPAEALRELMARDLKEESG